MSQSHTLENHVAKAVLKYAFNKQDDAELDQKLLSDMEAVIGVAIMRYESRRSSDKMLIEDCATLILRMAKRLNIVDPILRNTAIEFLRRKHLLRHPNERPIQHDS